MANGMKIPRFIAIEGKAGASPSDVRLFHFSTLNNRKTLEITGILA